MVSQLGRPVLGALQQYDTLAIYKTRDLAFDMAAKGRSVRRSRHRQGVPGRARTILEKGVRIARGGVRVSPAEAIGKAVCFPPEGH